MKVELLLAIEFNLAPQQIRRHTFNPQILCYGVAKALVLLLVKEILQNLVEFGFKGNFLNTFTLPKKI
jgi:hypothetical protein